MGNRGAPKLVIDRNNCYNATKSSIYQLQMAKTPQNAKNTQPQPRTRTIPVKLEPPSTDRPHFELHIDPAHLPARLNPQLSGAHLPSAHLPVSTNRLISPHLSIKIWNTLEWLATSALIFTVLFFALNYQSYSVLLIDKLNQLRGQITTNPFVQNLLKPDAANTEKPLPIAITTDQSKKQIPYLNLAVTPLDDRIVIPRINKNVPIVRANSENLIKHNWAGLEADIQEALRYGVVHYPGTAEPGDHGNVVITGHSSYFAWDPGRFKDVFALLHELKVGDKIIVYHQQRKYFYQVFETKVITPDQVDVLTQSGENRLTLITCTPVGTNLKRLIVFAKPLAE